MWIKTLSLHIISSLSELPPGTFAFSAIGRGVIRVDDVQVWSLDTNTLF